MFIVLTETTYLVLHYNFANISINIFLIVCEAGAFIYLTGINLYSHGAFQPAGGPEHLFVAWTGSASKEQLRRAKFRSRQSCLCLQKEISDTVKISTFRKVSVMCSCASFNMGVEPTGYNDSTLIYDMAFCEPRDFI